MKGITHVYDSALKLLVPQTVEETYATVVNEAMRLVDAKHGSIFIPDDGKLKRVYTSTKKLYKLKPLKQSPIYQAFDESISIMRSGKELAEDYDEYKKNPVGTDILIPLTFGHIAIGTLSVMSSADMEWGEEELNLLRTFGPIATLAIRSAQLKNELKNALEMRDLFISMAAHELKTPVTSIHLNAQIIQKAIKKDELPKISSVNTLVSETQRLTRLINELMDVAHVQQGKLRYDMKKVELTKIIKDTIKEFKEEYEDYKFVFKKKADKKKLFVKGDQDKLRQVFSNILSNSVKFSDEGSEITTKVNSKNDKYIIKIKDRGVGIPEDEMPHIFKRYYRGSTQRSSRRGIGLGLSLVQSIIQEHDGDIKISSKLKEGTVVTIDIPKYK